MICPHPFKVEHPHVTLDIDRVNAQYDRIYNGRGIMCVHYRVSANGNTHILLCVRYDFTVIEAFALRREFDDDIERWKGDWARWSASGDSRFASGVLFDMKDGKQAGVWIDL